MPYRSLIEALYTLNSSTVVSFNLISVAPWFPHLLWEAPVKADSKRKGALGHAKGS